MLKIQNRPYFFYLSYCKIVNSIQNFIPNLLFGFHEESLKSIIHSSVQYKSRKYVISTRLYRWIPGWVRESWRNDNSTLALNDFSLYKMLYVGENKKPVQKMITFCTIHIHGKVYFRANVLKKIFIWKSNANRFGWICRSESVANVRICQVRLRRHMMDQRRARIVLGFRTVTSQSCHHSEILNASRHFVGH